MASVTLEQVNKIYKNPKGANHVVKDVSLEIKDREFLVLVGPSGCGKTTTLRMVAGLEEISSGKIFIGERLVNDVSPKDRDIAMVFQNYALYPHMNVFENMAFGLRLRRFPREEIQRRVQEAASLLGIQNLLTRKPKELSGGQRQRVAMGRAIVREPRVFLMDEPLSNLDAKLRVQMRAELQKLHRRLGITTIYVTHDQTEAMTLGDRIVLMHNGIIQQVDTPLHMYEHPENQYVAGFIGSPSMNFVPAAVVKVDSQIFVEGKGFRLLVPPERQSALESYCGREMMLGIRPEHIYDRMFAQGAIPGNTLRAAVDVMEPMGAEIYLYLSIGDNSLIARVAPHTQTQVGQDMEVVIDMYNVHAFDKETERAIFTPSQAPAPA
ncbi:MAG: sn-glycerol-3-phosphate ABC transporter ATP-binding protein UgpC [Armatimonadetes bacterium]|nr:sn-glycerol-3-phosphate ABC transporter ATP-binding protein UgpC [Armatimonadota bacterium]